MNAMFFVHASLVAVVEQGAGHRSWGGALPLSLRGRYVPPMCRLAGGKAILSECH